MASIYQPSEERLGRALGLLGALRDPMNCEHVAAVTTLEETVNAGSLNREFGLLMLHIFVHGAKYGIAGDVRQLAGILVKNECIGMFNIGVSTQLAEDLNEEEAKTLLDTLQASILEGISDGLTEIRRMNAALLGKIASCYVGDYWVPLIPVITNKVQMALGGGDNGQLAKDNVEGYLYALRLVCEDGPEKLSMHASRPLDLLVPLFMNILHMPEGNVQSGEEGWLHSLKLNVLLAMNSLLPLAASNDKRQLTGSSNNRSKQKDNGQQQQGGASAITIHMATFLEALGKLAYCSHSEIRRAVCQSLSQLMSEQPVTLSWGLEGICKYMADAIRDSVESVAIEACEFWFSLILHQEAHHEIRKNITALLHGAIESCTLTEEEMLREREEEEKQASGERKIYFRASREGFGAGGGDDKQTQYTIRRSAALLLDNVAQLFPQQTAGVVVEKVQDLLKAAGSTQEEALKRESGMLVLGAIAGGCEEHLAPMLPGIYPYLFLGLRDAMPEVRGISCWVASRYMGAINAAVMSDDATERNQGLGILNTAFQGLGTALLDPSPKVQATACAALSATLQSCGDSASLLPLPSLLQQVYQASHSYGLKNRLLLMDLLSVVAETFVEEIAGPNGDGHAGFLSTFMPLLLPYYEESGPEEAVLTVSMECLQSFCSSFGISMAPYAPPLFSRAVLIMREILDAHEMALSEAADEGLEFDLPPTDTVYTALELISALLSGLGEHLPTSLPLGEDVYRNHSHVRTFLGLLSGCLKHRSEPLRGAALSVYGELLKWAPWTVAPTYSESLLAGMSSVLQVDEACGETGYMLVNACWSLGLYALLCRERQEEKAKLQAHLPRLLQRLVSLICMDQEEEHSHDLRTNFASCIGRVAAVEPELVADALPRILEDLLYCVAAMALDPDSVDGSEYLHAWLGIVSALQLNPNALMQAPASMRAFVHACSECSRLAQGQGQDHRSAFTTQTALIADIRSILEAIREKPAIWANSTSPEMFEHLQLYSITH